MKDIPRTDTIHAAMASMQVNAVQRTVTFTGAHEILLQQVAVTVPFAVLEYLIASNIAARAQGELKQRGIAIQPNAGH